MGREVIGLDGIARRLFVLTRATKVDLDDLGVAVTPLPLDETHAILRGQIDHCLGLAGRHIRRRLRRSAQRAYPQADGSRDDD